MHAGEIETSILLHAHPELVREGYHAADWVADDRRHLLITGMGEYAKRGDRPAIPGHRRKGQGSACLTGRQLRFRAGDPAEGIARSATSYGRRAIRFHEGLICWSALPTEAADLGAAAAFQTVTRAHPWIDLDEAARTCTPLHRFVAADEI
jgi:hypothetical protein